MKDSTLRLVLAGTLALGGLVGAFGILMTGIILDREVATVVAYVAVPSQALTAGVVFFLGHQNGIKAKNGG